jgi:nucleoside-triphosphatase THEP1
MIPKITSKQYESDILIAPTPPGTIKIVVTGQVGIGKTNIALAIARVLAEMEKTEIVIHEQDCEPRRTAAIYQQNQTTIESIGKHDRLKQVDIYTVCTNMQGNAKGLRTTKIKGFVQGAD